MPFPPLSAPLQRALDAHGYQEPTPVQAAVLVPDAEGRDLLVSARTGSGKTVAFGLAMGPTLLAGTGSTPRALVVAPTRELALQVARELEWLYAQTGLRIQACVGGMDPIRESRGLRAGAHIVVGTPGRLCDHLDRKVLDLSALSTVVLDEADEMLDMGFRDELEHLLDATPATRRSLLFSATIPKEIVEMAGRYQKNALRIATADSEEPHADIQYRMVPFAQREREHVVVNLLRFLEPKSALVFCMTREGVNHLHSALLERGFTAVALSGELSQAERGRALTALRDGRARVLVATDVAARGLDLPALDLVIHADLPWDAQTLKHRSGRTGRAGRKGTAVIMAPLHRLRIAERLVREAKVDAAWTPPPSSAAIAERDQERLMVQISEMPVGEEEDKALATRLLETHTAEDLAARLVAMCRGALPAPEELPETEHAVNRMRAPVRKPTPSGPAPGGSGVWFRVNIGREEDADPRWLVPLLCKKGGVEKRHIGELRIRDRDTFFEVAPDVADRFDAAAQRPDKRFPGLRFSKAGRQS